MSARAADDEWLNAVGSGSQVGRAMAAFDWSSTPLGPAALWPTELRSLVQLCLTTRFPMLVTWGRELHMIYNDGYRDMIGDLHPAAIGAPLRGVWEQIWDVVGPLADHVVQTGESVWFEHQRFDMNRNGFVEETYFTFSYSAIRDATGQSMGLVDISTETTGEVIAQRRLAALSSLGLVALSAPRVTDVCVAAINEIVRWRDDVVDADIYLRVHDDLVLMASTLGIAQSDVDPSLLREVSTRQTPLPIRDAAADPRLPPTAVMLPLAGDNGAPTGVLHIRPSPKLPDTVEHHRFLTAIATTIEGALGAAHARAMELGEQRHISETLQQAMLRPASDHPTVAARYRPAAKNLAVGGDWYDVIDLDEHRRAMVVGDCVGHGLEAAAVMGQLRSTTRALVLERHDPAAILERLDIVSASIPGAFATSVVCAIIDRLAGTVSYSRAGHLPPLLVEATGPRWLDQACGPPLQTISNRPRPQAIVDYTHGDLLVLYTDGLIERRDESLDTGLGRLEAAAERWFYNEASPQQIADGLLRDLLHQGDDDLVLVVKRLVVDSPPEPRRDGSG